MINFDSSTYGPVCEGSLVNISLTNSGNESATVSKCRFVISLFYKYKIRIICHFDVGRIN